MIKKFTGQFRTVYRDFSPQFWVLVLSAFVDRVGHTLVFPFFALYITQHFGVGMTEAGILFAIFSVTGFFGSFMGGALADKFGRRKLVLFGLVFSALSSVAMGLVNDLAVFYVLAAIVGTLSNFAGPARQAMLADLVPEEKRAEGFGVMRVAGNLAWIFGPTIGGLLAATTGYLLLFILDAVSSLITAVIVYKMLPETRPKSAEESVQSESMFRTLAGYSVAAKDMAFVAFVLSSILMGLVYTQLYNSFPVYLRDVHHIPEQGYGLLMSMNAGFVVLLQFWVTKQASKYAPLLMMALGTGLYMVGFTVYGFASIYVLFAAGMIAITFGEMVVMPMSQAIAAQFAPEDMRGRYMAFFSLAWSIPSAVGPWAAGLIMDNFDPRWVWYLSGIVAAIAAAGFLGLHSALKDRFVAQPVGG